MKIEKSSVFSKKVCFGAMITDVILSGLCEGRFS